MACMIDFQCLDQGFSGKTYKCKRQSQSNDVNDADTSMDFVEAFSLAAKKLTMAALENLEKPTFRKSTYDGVITEEAFQKKWK